MSSLLSQYQHMLSLLSMTSEEKTLGSSVPDILFTCVLVLALCQTNIQYLHG